MLCIYAIECVQIRIRESVDQSLIEYAEMSVYTNAQNIQLRNLTESTYQALTSRRDLVASRVWHFKRPQNVEKASSISGSEIDLVISSNQFSNIQP